MSTVTKAAASAATGVRCPTAHPLAHTALEALFTRLFTDPAARTAIGFRHVCAAPEGTGWYIWTDDRPGAYLLELMDTEPTTDLYSGTVSVPCLIHHYPHPEETAFAFLGKEAQALRTSSRFDVTGVPADLSPAACMAAPIPPESFLSGLLILRADPDMALVAFDLLAADGPQGWTASYALFDKLVQAHAYVHRTSPKRVRATERPLPDPSVPAAVWRGCTVVLALDTTRATPRIDLIPTPSKDLDVLADLTAPTVAAPTWIDLRWWDAATWSFAPH